MLDFLKKVWDLILKVLKLLGIIKDDPVIPPIPPTVGYKDIVVVSDKNTARLRYVYGFNDAGRPIFLPANYDNGNPVLALVVTKMKVYTFDESSRYVFESGGAILGDDGVKCYLIATGTTSSSKSASGYFILVENTRDI